MDKAHVERNHFFVFYYELQKIPYVCYILNVLALRLRDVKYSYFLFIKHGGSAQDRLCHF